MINMGKKTLKKKLRLAKANRRNRRLPAFIAAKTRLRVRFNRHRRNWRTQKLGAQRWE
jgi:large subunit ribosomal protein L39e